MTITAELIDHMGHDMRVCDAARVSMDKSSDNFTQKKNEGLLGYLSRNDHFTPFTHCVITLRETVPIFVARQRFKHQVGFSYNEISRRYVDTPPEFYVPDVWRKRAANVKQGSSDEIVEVLSGFGGEDEDLWGDLDNKGHPTLHVKYAYQMCLDMYNTLLKSGVCPEQARMVLPQSMMTSYYVTGSLAAFARAYKLRSDSHAQYEIRVLAAEWDRIIRLLFPVSWGVLVG